jgi:Mrp family chromosome partitioning ATPase
MITREQIIEALKPVKDPELGISIVDMDMVRDVKIEDRRILIQIALTVAHCPLAATIKEDVARIVEGLEGVDEVVVELTAMSREELQAVAEKVRRLKAAEIEQARGQVLAGQPMMPDKLGKTGIQWVLAVISGKGGVGKSSVTGLLASELRRQGFEVGVLDADITGSSITKLFGVAERPYANEARQIVPPRTGTGIKVIGMDLLIDRPTSPIIWRGPLVSSMVRQLYTDVAWQPLHFLLLDLPPGTSDIPLTIFQQIPLDGVIVVTTPQELAIMIVEKAINMARVLGVPVLGLIENMSYLECPHCGERVEAFGPSKAREAALEVGIPFLGSLPIDPAIARLADEGRIEEYESEAFRQVIRQLRLQLPVSKERPIAWNEANFT